jgi:pseudaminic acid cytidylyltransferase
MRIAIIPARGGSKRIPRKNIKLFYGAPMIGYPIKTAIESGLFEHVVVSTDDDEIAAISEKYGAVIPFIRPKALSNDEMPTVPVISHAIKECLKLGWDLEEVCCIYPCTPFLRGDDISRALDQLRNENTARYIMPVVKFPAPIERALEFTSQGELVPINSNFLNTRTQDLGSTYYDAGQFYWAKTDTWLSGLSIHSSVSGIVLPLWRGIDIDNLEDWQLAEKLFSIEASCPTPLLPCE